MFIEFLENTWGVLLELAPWLLLGVLIAGLLHVFVSSDWIRHRFSGVSGVLRSVLFGVPLPLCSCGVIPTGLGLKKDGASDGSTVAFLTSTPQTGVDSVLVSASFLGWPFAIFKVVAALVTGITGGLAAEFFGGGAGNKERTEVDEDHCGAKGGAEAPAIHNDSTLRQKLESGFFHMVDVLASIWGWLVFGILVAALISTVAPASGWSVLQNIGIWPAMLLVLAISTPLYVCATASVPIAAALVAAGMPTGAALVFLMAGPATNVATIGAIYRTLGGRNLAIYMVNVILGSLLLGWLFQGVIDPGAVSDVVAHGMEHSEWWRVGTAVLLTASFIYFAYSDLRQRFAAAKIERENTDDADSLTVGVSGMTCNGCVSKLTRNLQAVDGVEFAAVSLEPGSATIQGHASRSEIESAIRSSGFEPEETGADNASTCCSSA